MHQIKQIPPTPKFSKIAILGWGKEGQALYQYFQSQSTQIDIYDQKLAKSIIEKLAKANPNCQISFYDHFDLQGSYDQVFKSPGISFHKINSGGKPIDPSTFQLNSLINLLFERMDRNRIIAITGTKGKSTTASLIHHILTTNNHKSQLLGNIGNINLELLDNTDPQTWYVFEVSSFQAEFLKYSPRYAVFTSFYQDHQDVHSTMKEYLNAKLNLIKHQRHNDLAIFSPQFAESIGIDIGLIRTPYTVAGIRNIFESQLIGINNQVNCQLANLICQRLGTETQQIISAIAKYQPLKGRIESIGKFQSIEFFADDLATIPEATWSAIESLNGTKSNKLATLIVGGYDKGLDYTQLAKQLTTTKVQNFIYFNPTGQAIVKDLDKSKVNVVQVNNMQEAVEQAYQLTAKNKICLLSCASASFGLFDNAYDRGEQYRQYVKDQGSKNDLKTID